MSPDSDGEEESRENLKKPQTLSKDQPGTSAAEKIERALDMMRKRRTLPNSDDENSSSSLATSSSPSPIRRTWGAISQRKTGHTTGGSGISKKVSKMGRQSRSISKVSRKQTHKGIATSSTNTRKKGRRKKKRSSSSESGKSQNG